MKTFGIIAVVLSMGVAALADTILSPGAGFVSVPGGFQSTTGTNAAPFWNNNSMDGTNMNAGDFLTGSNPSGMGSTNYLSSGAGFGNYLSIGGSGLDAPTNFSFIQSDPTVDVTLLYANAAANTEYNYPWLHLPGTEIGLYNVQDPSQKEVLFAHGTLANPLGGIYNNDVSPQSTSSVGTFANYGVYATTCEDNGTIRCYTVYSNSALNPADETNHEHFALFQNAQDPQTYFVAFEDATGISPTEGYGDFNDVIFSLQTTQNPNIIITTTPEPATWSAMGLGLLGVGLLRRRATRSAQTN